MTRGETILRSQTELLQKTGWETRGLNEWRHPKLPGANMSASEAWHLQNQISSGKKHFDRCPMCKERFVVCRTERRFGVCWGCRPAAKVKRDHGREKRKTGITPSTEITRMIEIPVSLHTFLRTLAAEQQITLRHLVYTMLLNQLKATKGIQNEADLIHLVKLENAGPLNAASGG